MITAGVLPRLRGLVMMLVVALAVSLGLHGTATAAALVKPGVPTAVTMVPSDGVLGVSWAPPVSGGPVASYEVVTSRANGAVVTRTSVPSSARDVLVTGLTNGSTYYMRVTAVNAAGSTSKAYGGATPRITPPRPFALTTLTAGPASISVGWSASAAGTYPISRYTVHLFEGYQNIWRTSVRTVILTPDQPRLVTFTNLNPRTSYFAEVVASDVRVVTDSYPVVREHQTRSGRLNGWMWSVNPK